MGRKQFEINAKREKKALRELNCSVDKTVRRSCCAYTPASATGATSLLALLVLVYE
jgi:hypothetical protein